MGFSTITDVLQSPSDYTRISGLMVSVSFSRLPHCSPSVVFVLLLRVLTFYKFTHFPKQVMELSEKGNKNMVFQYLISISFYYSGHLIN